MEAKTATKMLDDILKSIFYRANDMGILDKELAEECLGTHASTFCKKKKNKYFTFDEVCLMCEYVGLELTLTE